MDQLIQFRFVFQCSKKKCSVVLIQLSFKSVTIFYLTHLLIKVCSLLALKLFEWFACSSNDYHFENILIEAGIKIK